MPSIHLTDSKRCALLMNAQALAWRTMEATGDIKATVRYFRLERVIVRLQARLQQASREEAEQ